MLNPSPPDTQWDWTGGEPVKTDNNHFEWAGGEPYILSETPQPAGGPSMAAKLIAGKMI